MPRFVVLRHETPPGHERLLHWDLMLQSGDVLRSWALAEEPRQDRPVLADALADHRPAYLDYEGPLRGNRGEVMRWDEGSYQLVEETDHQLVVLLDGRKLRGKMTLTRLDEPPQRWRVVFEGD